MRYTGGHGQAALLERQGIGTQAFESPWRAYPLSKRWALGTPGWNRRTQHFYRKVGFSEIGRDAHGGVLFERRMEAEAAGGGRRGRTGMSGQVGEVAKALRLVPQVRTKTMELTDKLEALGQSAQYDLCNSCGAAQRRRDDLGRWIYPAALPDGGTVRLLKVLLTNVCEKDCYYCATRAGRDVPRTSFTPEELARSFDLMHRANLVDGLFLSSGVCGSADRTMDRMIACVELLRRQFAFPGYVHLKLLPGASTAHIETAMRLAQRVSVNLEATGPERLVRIAPRKVFYEELTRPLQEARRLLDEGSGGPAGGSARLWAPGRLAPAGITTQFVVGAAGESDRELLTVTDRLYRTLRLARAYFSAFQPVPGTPLDGVPATPAWREHRLYQADWLLRFYGFSFDDLVFSPDGYLPRQADPKRLYAQAHPELYPVEVNRASRQELLRVPGLGPRSVAQVLRMRREGVLRDLEDLARAGAVVSRAAPYVLLDGRRPPFQLPLWEG